MEKMFAEHIAKRIETTEKVLSKLKYDGLLISSGKAFEYFSDDMGPVHHETPHFSHWCPAKGEHHLICFKPGRKPTLYYYHPVDFWHEHAPLPNTYWTSQFEIIEISNPEDAFKLDLSGRWAYIGPSNVLSSQDFVEENPSDVVAHLDWYRSFKSDFEVHCIEKANEVAARGHKKAKEVFLAGGSERDIYFSYLQATGHLDTELPYQTIIGLDEKAAVLHYHPKSLKKNGKVLLIDAGASFENYASDITRTFLSPSVDSDFKGLWEAVEKSQLKSCDDSKPGVSTISTFHSSLLDLSRILLDLGVLKNLTPEQAVDEKIINTFFPHGLGHMLGIQVHDVGGRQVDEEGTPTSREVDAPLRAQRPLAEGNVLTIEPGIYFIDSLLSKHRDNNNNFNWALIDKLTPFGGIRIEDNIVITKDGHRNLTRPYLP